MSVFTSDYLTISYHNEPQLLTARWMRSIMPFEMHRGYGALLEGAAAHSCRFWLLDTRRRTSIDATDVHWMLEEFYPKLLPRLGRTTYLAFLMAPHQLAGVLANAGIPPLSMLDGQPYVVQRFTEEAAGLHWLQQARQQEAVAVTK